QARAKQAAHPMAYIAIPGDDPRKAAVDAAIARAKARKQEQQAGREPAEPDEPRKAAVEAAIARAKARKQEQQPGSEPAQARDP
ncbi:electron transport complex subunit RsxC, partial [Salmonella enterica subsp. enterica serovar Infantis]